MNKDQKFVITIGRERGSGGRMVGKELHGDSTSTIMTGRF